MSEIRRTEVTESPLYLQTAPHPSFVFLHLPREAERKQTGVVICPPFGWEEVCSYRSRRAWARYLADEGHPVLRIDLPGTGDSAGSPRDPARLEAWAGAVEQAAAWLQATTGCARVAAIGIGLGGMVAVRAAARGAPIDDFVLWAVPARGRSLVRELEMFARLEAQWAGEAATDEAGELSVGGFLLTEETLASLRDLDLTRLELPDAARRRVMLLERDGLAPDERLRSHLEQGGAAVEVAPGPGYGQMMDDPRWARPPTSVFAPTAQWLAGGERVAAGRPALGEGELGYARKPRPEGHEPPAAQTLALAVDGCSIEETPLFFELGGQRLFGVLAVPVAQASAGICVVLLNAGPQRRIGPNRMWVEIARRWTARGVPTVRMDMVALGDSDGDERQYVSESAYYLPNWIDTTVQLLDDLERRGLPGRFVLAGLCSGAYWSFRVALRDERVLGALMINLWSFFWSRGLHLDRGFARASALLRKRENVEWAALMFTVGLLRAPLRAARRRLRRREIVKALDRLQARGKQLLFVFSSGEPLLGDIVADRLLARIQTAPTFAIEQLPSSEHTLRAPALQRQLHEYFDAALEQTLAESSKGASALSSGASVAARR